MRLWNLLEKTTMKKIKNNTIKINSDNEKDDVYISIQNQLYKINKYNSVVSQVGTNWFNSEKSELRVDNIDYYEFVDLDE